MDGESTKKVMSAEAKAARREYMRRWSAANKDKVRANNARYWERRWYREHADAENAN